MAGGVGEIAVGGTRGEGSGGETTASRGGGCGAPAGGVGATGKGTSGVTWAMGAELAPASSARPCEGDRAGEARASRSPSPAGGGAAMDGASRAPFSFFAAGANLFKRRERQASAAEQEIKTR